MNEAFIPTPRVITANDSDGFVVARLRVDANEVFCGASVTVFFMVANVLFNGFPRFAFLSFVSHLS